MKNSTLIFLLSLLVLWGCNNAPATLTDAEKEQIEAEVFEQFNISGQGIEEKDAAKAFSVFSTQEGVKYIRNGHLYPTIETAEKQYAEWFTASQDAPKQTLTSDPILFDILDRNTVILTTIGSLKAENDTASQPWVIAYTMVWRKEDSGWKLFHMHNSWE